MGSEIVLDQVTASAVIVMVIEWLKRAKSLPWISQQSDKLNRILAAILAGAAAIGIHMEFDSTAGVLTITGLTLTTILHGLWDWVKSIAAQELIYRGVIKANGVPKV